MARSLQATSNSNLVVAFEALISTQCGASTCSYATAEELGTQLYAAATGALKTALQDGSFRSELQDDLPAIAAIQDILDGATVSVDFEDVIIPLLQRFPSSSVFFALLHTICLPNPITFDR